MKIKKPNTRWRVLLLIYYIYKVPSGWDKSEKSFSLLPRDFRPYNLRKKKNKFNINYICVLYLKTFFLLDFRYTIFYGS